MPVSSTDSLNSFDSFKPRVAYRRPLVLTIVALALLLAWDASGLDLPLARLAGTADGFALRDNRLVILLLHEVPRFASMAGVVGLCFAVRWPIGFLRRLALRERLQLAVTVLASVAAVSLIKNGSHSSCPWDLEEFGGVARYVSHWNWGIADGGPGRCFPAGHASAAFAFAGGWFVLRHAMPRIARRWLAAAVVMGFVLGLAQQWRGAHYMSHTLWTAWLCWTLGMVIDIAWPHGADRLKLNES